MAKQTVVLFAFVIFIHTCTMSIGEAGKSVEEFRSERCVVIQKQSVGLLGALDYYDYGENATETPAVYARRNAPTKIPSGYYRKMYKPRKFSKSPALRFNSKFNVTHNRN